MTGSVLLITKRGFRFLEVPEHNLKELIWTVERLKRERQDGQEYQFTITLDHDKQIICTDFLIEGGWD